MMQRSESVRKRGGVLGAIGVNEEYVFDPIYTQKIK